MKIVQEKINLSVLRQKALVLAISATLTSGFASSIVQASDIDIYQTAKSGDITLMFLIDISGSMTSEHNSTSFSRPACELSTNQSMTAKNAMETPVPGGPTYRRQWCEVSKTKYYDRITRVKDGMMDLLYGNPAKNITRISDDKYVGLSTLGANNGIRINTNRAATYANGAVLIPSRRLDAIYGGKTQRQILIDAVIGLEANSATPTARSYAESVAYMMGTSTSGKTGSGWAQSLSETKVGSGNNQKYNTPNSLDQTEEAKKCSGQGVYVLTDGEPTVYNNTQDLMKSAIGNTSFSCGRNQDDWNCINSLAIDLLNPAKNLMGLKFKTAVVGFGGDFNSTASYDKNKTQEENINALGTINNDVKRAAYWGIIGQGGWYSGNSSEDVVDSVNEFINSLGSDIPAVTTGTPTIPNDELNPSVLQSFAYYPQFQPTPDKSYQLWVGNLKKYNVSINGKLTDSSNSLIVNDKGRLLQNVDLWAPALVSAVEGADENTLGSKKNRLMGGIKSQLMLRAEGTTTTVNRKLLTNRVVSTSGVVTSGTALKRITLDYLNEAGYKTDSARGHLMSLLGYAIDPTDLSKVTVTGLTSVTRPNELRQVGAVMHSSPVLLTNEGKVTYDAATNTLGSEQRQDFVVFGTAQGLLHVVNAKTGQEKFAFVPNEMIENQKEAFLAPEMATGGLNKMFYGVDGAWTVYSEYVLDGAGKLTVGAGKNLQDGKQLIYGGLRMGGRGYYALDLANIESPKLKFQISPDAVTSGPLSYMGQSWSKPTLGWVRWGKQKKLVMFVGGGYDAGGSDGNAKVGGIKGAYAGYEGDEYQQGSNGRGAGVYMFDALNGDLLWWASSKATTSSVTTTSGTIGLNDPNLKYSVVSEITTADRDSDGLIDHLYFGDLGGQVFRIDLNNKATAQGSFANKSRRILNLSQTDGKAPRFYEAPSFSIYDVDGKTFAVVSIGSGNRSLPLQEYTVGSSGRNYDSVYNIYDKDVTNSALYTMTDAELLTKDITLNTTTGLKAIADSNRFGVSDYKNLTAPYSTNGWYYQFKSKLLQSEKVFSTPIVINNDMYISTFDGSKDGLSGDCGAGVKGESFLTKFCMPYGQCSNTGTANDYKLNLGAGITGGTIGAGDGGGTRLIVANIDTSNLATGGSAILDARYNTKMSLVVQRWYEKYK